MKYLNFFYKSHSIYTATTIKQCPLRIARYCEKIPSLQELSVGWDRWTIWQYSNQGSVVGITGHVGLNDQCHRIITKSESVYK